MCGVGGGFLLGEVSVMVLRSFGGKWIDQKVVVEFKFNVRRKFYM